MGSEIVEAVEPVVDALDALGVTYRIGGSVASSALGVPRSTLDVDLVCNLKLEHAERFVSVLKGTFYVDAEMVRDAIRQQSSFNLVHLATMLKVDVFILKSMPWDVQAFSRSVRGYLEPAQQGRSFYLTTAEDIILHKLQWYQLGGGVSERQWRDALGVLLVQADAIDWQYLRHWAAALGLSGLLDKAVVEAREQ